MYTPIITMKNMRDRDFMLACCKIVEATGGRLTQAQVARRAASMEAPAFYVSFDYAMRRLSAMRRCNKPLRLTGGAADLFVELNLRVSMKMALGDRKLSQALTEVLSEGRASGFFLTPASAVFLYKRLRREQRVRRRSPRHRPIPPIDS